VLNAGLFIHALIHENQPGNQKWALARDIASYCKSLILYTEHTRYSQSDSFSNSFRLIQFPLGFSSTKQIFFSDFCGWWELFFACLLLIRFLHSIVLFLKDKLIHTQVLVCLFVYPITQKAVHAWKLTNRENGALWKLINHQDLCFVEWDLVTSGRT